MLILLRKLLLLPARLDLPNMGPGLELGPLWIADISVYVMIYSTGQCLEMENVLADLQLKAEFNM